MKLKHVQYTDRRKFRALCWRAPPTVRNSGQTLHSVGQAWLSVVRNWEMSAIQVFLLCINHSEFSWYIKQCPLLGRGPLLGASVNGELTVKIALFTGIGMETHKPQLFFQCPSVDCTHT